MQIKDLLYQLNRWAPFHYQESYDNSGLLVGFLHQEVERILVTIDIDETVMNQAIDGGFRLIISHHPIIFKGLKSLSGKTMEERVVMAAIQNQIAIIAMHTNLDNSTLGVNRKIAQLLELTDARILQPLNHVLRKLVVFVPVAYEVQVRQALFDAGAGTIGQYDQCSFNIAGTGTFRAGKEANPFVGEAEKLHHEPETRIETIFPQHLQTQIIRALVQHHPYEKPAYDIYTINNEYPEIGAGMIGNLKQEMPVDTFLQFLKTRMKTPCIRYNASNKEMISRVAVCGGSGSFLISAAMAQQADVFITGDVKYHDFFIPDHRMMIADIGHYESEQFTKELISEFLIENFPKFAVQISEHQTNPIKYF